jgi:hypothetical protein
MHGARRCTTTPDGCRGLLSVRATELGHAWRQERKISRALTRKFACVEHRLRTCLPSQRGRQPRLRCISRTTAVGPPTRSGREGRNIGARRAGSVRRHKRTWLTLNARRRRSRSIRQVGLGEARSDLVAFRRIDKRLPVHVCGRPADGWIKADRESLREGCAALTCIKSSPRVDWLHRSWPSPISLLRRLSGNSEERDRRRSRSSSTRSGRAPSRQPKTSLQPCPRGRPDSLVGIACD